MKLQVIIEISLVGSFLNWFLFQHDHFLYHFNRLSIQSIKTTRYRTSWTWSSVLLVFGVTPLKIDQNKNQNRSIDKVQNLGNERRLICKDSRQDSGHSNFSYARYAEKFFTQIYRDLYGDAMLVPIRMGTYMAAGNQQKLFICHWVLLQKRDLSLEKL